MWVVLTPQISNGGLGFLESVQKRNPILDSFKFRPVGWCKSLNAGLREPYLASSRISGAVASGGAGEIGLSSEKKVYDVILKQAALAKRILKSRENARAKPDIVFPTSLGSLTEGYDRCRQVCAEHSKSFYLGTLLLPRERQRAIWAIYAWCRRTADLVDGPKALNLTSTTLDEWEARLEDIFIGSPSDLLDAAHQTQYPSFLLTSRPFRDMIEGMKMDQCKSSTRLASCNRKPILWCVFMGAQMSIDQYTKGRWRRCT